MNKVANIEEVTDVLEAVNIALDYLSKKGIVVFTREIRSVLRNSLIWVVEIDGNVLTGVVAIKTKTGEVVWDWLKKKIAL